MWSWTPWRPAAKHRRVDVPARDRHFPAGSEILYDWPNFKIEIVFIHEITGTRDKAQMPRLLRKNFPRARMSLFGYDTSGIQDLGNILDPGRLEQCAIKLLEEYPLNLAPGIRGSSPQREQSSEAEGPDTRLETHHPVIFVAHGFGGLIYEQALVLSYENQEEQEPRDHAAILMNTPHHGAGMAEWAIMCAKQLGIKCADTAQKEDWSRFEAPLRKIEDMQRSFRAIHKKVKVNIAGCYAIRPVPNRNLSLAPEWAVLPDFQPISMDKSHFEMTELDPGKPAFQRIAKTLDSWAEERCPSWMSVVSELGYPVQSLSRGFEEMYSLAWVNLATYPKPSNELARCGNHLEILHALLIRHIFLKSQQELFDEVKPLVEGLERDIEQFASEMDNRRKDKELDVCLQNGTWPKLEQKVNDNVQTVCEKLLESQGLDASMAEKLELKAGILQNIQEGSTYRIYAPNNFMSEDDRKPNGVAIYSSLDEYPYGGLYSPRDVQHDGKTIFAVVEVTKLSLNRSEAKLLTVPTLSKIESKVRAELQSTPVQGTGYLDQFEWVLNLENGNSSNLGREVEFEYEIKPEKIADSERRKYERKYPGISKNGDEIPVEKGMYLRLRVKNNSRKVVYFTVLDLQKEPEPSIEEVSNNWLVPGETGNRGWKAEEPGLDKDGNLSTDSSLNVLKAIATTEQTSWNLLHTRGVPPDELDIVRHPDGSTLDLGDWTTKTLTVRTIWTS